MIMAISARYANVCKLAEFPAWQDAAMGTEADVTRLMAPQLEVLLPHLDERSRRLVLALAAGQLVRRDPGRCRVCGVYGVRSFT
jgi:hypothetical protein